MPIQTVTVKCWLLSLIVNKRKFLALLKTTKRARDKKKSKLNGKCKFLIMKDRRRTKKKFGGIKMDTLYSSKMCFSVGIKIAPDIEFLTCNRCTKFQFIDLKFLGEKYKKRKKN